MKKEQPVDNDSTEAPSLERVQPGLRTKAPIQRLRSDMDEAVTQSGIEPAEVEHDADSDAEVLEAPRASDDVPTGDLSKQWFLPDPTPVPTSEGIATAVPVAGPRVHPGGIITGAKPAAGSVRPDRMDQPQASRPPGPSPFGQPTPVPSLVPLERMPTGPPANERDFSPELELVEPHTGLSSFEKVVLGIALIITHITAFMLGMLYVMWKLGLVS